MCSSILFCLLFETASHCVAEAVLDLLCSPGLLQMCDSTCLHYRCVHSTRLTHHLWAGLLLCVDSFHRHSGPKTLPYLPKPHGQGMAELGVRLIHPSTVLTSSLSHNAAVTNLLVMYPGTLRPERWGDLPKAPHALTSRPVSRHFPRHYAHSQHPQIQNLLIKNFTVEAMSLPGGTISELQEQL